MNGKPAVLTEFDQKERERITRVHYWLMKRRSGQDGLNPFGTS